MLHITYHISHVTCHNHCIFDSRCFFIHRLCSDLVGNILKLFGVPIFWTSTWWMLFQKCIMHTKFDVYVSIGAILYLGGFEVLHFGGNLYFFVLLFFFSFGHCYRDRHARDRMHLQLPVQLVLSPLTLWVRTSFIARCTRYNIMW